MLRGRAWKFGHNVSTDQIAPGRYFHLRSDLPELAKHVLEDANPEFARNVQPEDLIVAGRNFGLGSSREHAASIIKLRGISAVLAQSFARIFFRNAINIGLPVIICDTDRIAQGDVLEVDLLKGRVRDVTRNIELDLEPLPGVMLAILQDGGLINHVQKHGDFSLYSDRGKPSSDQAGPSESS
ncbi:MAG: 3-isopropylmalate dehydratase small subunit [Chloroflexi bacterium]|nr:3-isopropylmalate dehydratase small subunit [Chloroflexota bacterium]